MRRPRTQTRSRLAAEAERERQEEEASRAAEAKRKVEEEKACLTAECRGQTLGSTESPLKRMVRQPSPAATRQEVPFGVDRMMVQVSPSPVVRTSTMPPELVTPTAIGASLYS